MSANKEKYLLNDEALIKVEDLYTPPTKDEWAIKPDHMYWRRNRIARAQLAHCEPLIRAEGIHKGRRQVIDEVKGMIHIAVIDQDRYSVIDMLKFSELFKELEETESRP